MAELCSFLCVHDHDTRQRVARLYHSYKHCEYPAAHKRISFLNASHPHRSSTQIRSNMCMCYPHKLYSMCTRSRPTCHRTLSDFLPRSSDAERDLLEELVNGASAVPGARCGYRSTGQR